MLIISQDKKYLVTLENGMIYDEGDTITYKMIDGSLCRLGEYSNNGNSKTSKAHRVIQNIFAAQDLGHKTFTMPQERDI